MYVLPLLACLRLKCTYEKNIFPEIICALKLFRAEITENAHIKQRVFRISYVCSLKNRFAGNYAFPVSGSASSLTPRVISRVLWMSFDTGL